MLVAVYGTLKTGEYNYDLFLEGEEPVFRSFVKLPFEMYANEEYPMLVPADTDSLIFVEVFDVDELKLAELDTLELPYGYWRERIHLPELDAEVEIYLHPAPPPHGFMPIASGKWLG